jgi:DNA invertase Pin-like site-specific DNA recombinase
MLLVTGLHDFVGTFQRERAAGRTVFAVLGAVAELERSLIVGRVEASLRNTRVKGKRLGRPRKVVDAS